MLTALGDTKDKVGLDAGADDYHQALRLPNSPACGRLRRFSSQGAGVTTRLTYET